MEEVYINQKIRIKRNSEIKFFFPNFHFRLLFSKTMNEVGSVEWCQNTSSNPSLWVLVSSTILGMKSQGQIVTLYTENYVICNKRNTVRNHD